MRLASIFFVTGLLGLAPGLAGAAGFNIAWDTCAREGGTVNRTFACNTNLDTGNNANVLIVSFVPAEDVPQFVAAEAFINIMTLQPLPSWWGSSCPGKAVVLVDLVSPCLDEAYGGPAFSGVAAYNVGTMWDHWFVPNPNSAELDVVGAAGVDYPKALMAGEEYFAFHLIVRNARTTGTSACEGCLVPACISLAELRVDQPAPVPEQQILVPDVQGFVFWQSNLYTACSATPARTPTWGAIKSFYR